MGVEVIVLTMLAHPAIKRWEIPEKYHNTSFVIEMLVSCRHRFQKPSAAFFWGWLSTKVLIQIKSKTNVVILLVYFRSSIFLVKDTQEHKVQKILTWSDFGPYKSLDDKALQSIAKSISSLEVGSIFFFNF